MLSKYKHPLIILLFFIFGCLFFHDFLPSVLIDIPREFLIPRAMLEGKLLYKDILNIYGALPYYLAALFVKLFGFKISTFFALNAINALFFIFGVYFLSCEFLSKRYSCCVALSVLFISVFNIYLFNFIFPYSICYTFGLCAYIYATLFLIKFVKAQNNYKFLYASSLLAGLSVACKNEFIFLPLVFLIVFIINRKKYDYRIFYSILLFFVFPLIQLIILFLNGLSFDNLFTALEIIKTSAITPAMTDFHHEIGMLPKMSISTLVVLSVYWGLILFFYSLQKTHKKLAITLFFVLCCVINYFPFGVNIFFFLPILCFVFICAHIKKYIEKKELLVLSLCALFASLKTFCFLTFNAYGAYTIAILLIYFAIKCVHYKQKNALKFLLIFSFTFFISSCLFKTIATTQMQINDFKFSVKNKEILVFSPLNDWIEKNVEKDDEILVFPEGLGFYIVQNKKTDYMLYSLHNIFVQTFGDEYIKKRILNSKIKYIIDISEFNCGAKSLVSLFSKRKYIEEILGKNARKIDTINIFAKDKNISVYIYKKETP